MKIETELTTLKNWRTGTQGKSVFPVCLPFNSSFAMVTVGSLCSHKELTGQDLTILINNRYRCTTHAIPNGSCLQQL